MKKATVVLLFLCILLMQPVLGNPVPVSESGGALTIDENTPVILRYENVTYVIEKEHAANVTAIYRLQNPTGGQLNLTVFLPFDERVPDDLSLQQDNWSISYNRTNDGAPLRPAVAFTCSIASGETSQVAVTYSLRIAGRNHQVVTDRFDCTYMAETGQHWNGSIAEATFTFMVAKDLYSYGLSGFNLTETADYMVARTTYTNWTSDGNIAAVWYNINAFGKALFILIPVGIIVAVVLVIRMVKKKTGRTGS